MPPNQPSTGFQPLEGMLQIAMSNCCGSYHERAVGNRFRHRIEFFCMGQQIPCAYGGTGILKSHVVGIHHSQVKKPKVAHRPGSGADIKRIAHVHQDNAQLIEFSKSRQAGNILR